MHEIELQFAPAETACARDAARQVFPGCPLTFHLADALRLLPLPLERFVLPETASARLPDAPVLEKLWRAQFSDTARWQLAGPPQPDNHFTLLALARCEIQAMDQHWSLHRVAVSLADGEPVPDLSRDISFYQAGANAAGEITWPPPDPERWRELMKKTLEKELAPELDRIRGRQESSLRRELERVDDYFESYQRELRARAKRSSDENSRLKTADRLAAAQTEHARRRADQLARHEIRVHPHLDGLLLVAEKAWRARVRFERSRLPQELEALFIPRSRQWKWAGSGCQT
jgi:hypothetical protein